MAKEETLRSSIDDKYKWDLSTIYKNDDAWSNDYDIAKKEINKASSFKNDFLSSSKKFLTYLKYDEKTDRMLNKLYYYANLNYDSDTLNDHYKTMRDEVLDLFQKYSSLSAFVIPEIIKTDYKIFEKYFKESKELAKYKFMIDDIYRFKDHTLDEKSERMLSLLSNSLSNPEASFESLTDSDFTFKKIIDEDGKEKEFNDSNYSLYIKSNNRRVRKDAFNIMLSKYEEFKNTLATTFSGNVERGIALAKIRNYDSALSSSLFESKIDISVYDNLIKTVNENMYVMDKYYALKKDVLKLDELHLYDIYTDLIKQSSKKYEFEDAKTIVINALSVLGEDYVKNLNKAFSDRFIDVYHNKGKRSGAYSSGFYDTNPFVLLNYEGTLDDVSALAHELGHSMHTYYSCKYNDYEYSSYKIFVAEVASTVNELLLSKYLLENSKSKEEKLSVLDHVMNLFKGTLYRQTMFAEFEKMEYQKRESGSILTSTSLSDDYYELVKKYFGKGVVIDDKIRYEWARIPHFYYDFYVFKYATGISAAAFIVDGILSEKKGALENYLKFLKTGGSNYPIEELKVAGVDMNSADAIKSAIKMFDEEIEEFKEIYNS